MEKLTHWKKMVNYDYLGAYSLEKGEEKTLTIKSIGHEMVTSSNGKKEQCVVAYFSEEKKGMVLNRTNMKTITKIYETPYIEEWINKKIIVFATNVRLGGEFVEALRVKDVKIEEKPQKPILSKGKNFDAIVEKLKSKEANVEKVLQHYTVSDELLKELKSYETV